MCFVPPLQESRAAILLKFFCDTSNPNTVSTWSLEHSPGPNCIDKLIPRLVILCSDCRPPTLPSNMLPMVFDWFVEKTYIVQALPMILSNAHSAHVA